jgi:flagellar FliL protein|tara:strand:- start:1707 stop:2261 length:555 start_codon:yes stop_codon:yes gene_type:complete
MTVPVETAELDMAEEPEAPEEEVKKPSKLPLILGVVLALVGAGGGFFAVSSGLLPFGGGSSETAMAEGHAMPEKPDPGPPPEDVSNVEFIPMEPMLISLMNGGAVRHLRFTGQIEVESEHRADVEKLMPRILDVLNGFMRAIEVGDLSDSLTLNKLRAQMLHRVQIVSGRGRVRDLLITEFVLN